jgi:hypothetical protein
VEAWAEILKRIVPLALKDHRGDVVRDPVRDDREKRGGDRRAVRRPAISDAKGIFDKDLVDFFTSSAPMAESAS